jgi:hypothetical protein
MFEDLSDSTGFQMDVLEKVYRLTELLRDLSGMELGNDLSLKGGTAINFLYLDLPRLSVDIDLDYIGSVDKEQMEGDREEIDDVLGRLFGTLNYQPEERTSYALQKYNLFYRNAAGNRDRIELEINYLKRATILNSIRERFKHPFDFEDFQVLTLQLEELFGRKMTALVYRGTAKDLYDTYQLLASGLSFNREAMRKCFQFSLCLNGDPREVDSTNLDQITGRELKQSLLPMLRKGESVELAEMKGKVKPLVEDFLTFRDTEMEFVERLFEEQQYEPELLFQNVEFNRRLKNHPGIDWRLRNI